MSDLLSQDNVDQFRQAMRDITDTFHKTPVTLQRVSGGEVDLLAGMKPSETGDDGEVNGELYAREDRQETVERYLLSFNRDYLAEMGLIDDVMGNTALLISAEDRVMINGKRFSIVKLTDQALFRGVPILVTMVVVR